MVYIRSLTEVIRSHTGAAKLYTLVSLLQDLSLHCSHHRSCNRNSCKPTCRAASERVVRGELLKQGPQLPAELQQYPTHLCSILLHVIALNIDIHKTFDFHFYIV